MTAPGYHSMGAFMSEPHLCEDYPQAQLDHDFSQSGEQEVLLRAIAGLPVGRFLDIGAGDGETFSNTRCLALRGWGGVVVEPAAWAFDRLVQLYAGRPDIDCVQAVVTGAAEAAHGLVPWFYAMGDHLSTVERSEAAKWPQVPFKRTRAAAVCMGQLLDDTYVGGREPSVVSVDAEGLTEEIVLAYVDSPYWEYVRVVCYEHCNLRLKQPFVLAGETPNNRIYRRVA